MPKPGIPDSTCKFFPDSGFYKHKLPGLGRSGLKGDAERNHRVGMTGLDPYSMVTLIYRLSGARNFLLQSSAKLTTGIPRANQKPTQDCLSRLQDSLSWLGLGAHEGYQWCQQTTSTRFQALRSCTKPQTS